MSSKLGRKGKIQQRKEKYFTSLPCHSLIALLSTPLLGDPRMHKAVAARLANPSLSLYEALCIGGFDYSENDDKSVLDSKKVTLGQRKNQLSRRLRLARKQGAGTNKISSTDINRALFNGNTGNPNAASGTKKVQINEKHLEGKSDDHVSSLGHHRTKMELINELGTRSYNNNSNGRNGEAMGSHPHKRHRFTKCLNSTTFERTCTMASAMNQKLNGQYLHQGWPLATLPHMGRDGNPSAMSMAGSAQGINYTTSQYYSPQMSNRISDQNVQRFQHGSSAVALSSLAATAQSVGLSLDQLALTLSSNTTSLSKLVAEVRSGDSEIKQEQMALDLYQADVKGLYSKCLLVAGVDASLAEQNTPTYIKFATRAWEAEGKRLRSLQERINRGKLTKSVTIASSPRYLQATPSSRDQGNDSESAETPTASNFDRENQDQSIEDRNYEYNENVDQKPAESGNTIEKNDCTKCDARHMHRLGDCGHKAVIHQPKDGPPHIDFIVNDQIECYANNDSVSLAGRSFDTGWPSKYKCKDVDDPCGKHCGKSVASSLDTTWGNMETLPEPKVFKLSEIETGDPEWSFDASEDVDGGVMGLFKLGREASSEIANN